MENEKKEREKQGVIPESELQGSDADKAYSEKGGLTEPDNDKASNKTSEVDGSEADQTGNPAL